MHRLRVGWGKGGGRTGVHTQIRRSRVCSTTLRRNLDRDGRTSLSEKQLMWEEMFYLHACVHTVEGGEKSVSLLWTKKTNN